jgi:hypothetical protein
MDGLVAKRTLKQVRAGLLQLSHGSHQNTFFGLYDEAIKRIRSQTGSDSALAVTILGWISTTRRTLTEIELRHALAVEDGSSELDEENMLEVDDLVSVCAGLVAVDTNSGIVKLVHYTLADYLQQHRSELFECMDRDIASCCLTYLYFTGCAEPCVQDTEYHEGINRYPFNEYAARSWGYHAQHSWKAIREQALVFLQDDGRVVATSQRMEEIVDTSWMEPVLHRSSV